MISIGNKDLRMLRLRNVTALLIVLCALSQVFGLLVDSSFLMKIGKTSGFAPLPRPFGAIQDYEMFKGARTATFFWSDGNSETVNLKSVTHLLEGPHRVKIVYMQGVGLLPVVDKGYVQPVLEHLLCERIPMLFSKKRPREVQINLEENEGHKKDGPFLHIISCL